MENFLIKSSTIIIYLHIFSAIIWIGGMITIRVAVHPALQSIDSAKLKIGTTLQIIERLFNLVLPFIVILIVSALIYEIYYNIKSPIVHFKEAIWTIMTINFTIMYIKRLKAQKQFDIGNIQLAKKSLSIISRVLLPINIFLGISATILGIILRGF